jgi:putative oxygen-independent coproporphyrinogen III oxidase
LPQSLVTSLYIHMPWCIKKCPYCDFNSHQKSGSLPEMAYVEQLLKDFALDLEAHPRTHLHSIFIGGGTPSLFGPEAYERLFQGIKELLPFSAEMEITLEANPGTLDMGRFRAYRELGINRLSLGVQSFHSHHLQQLGRIHDGKTALAAIEMAQAIGFKHLNVDLMYALGQQTLEEAIEDLSTAIAMQPSHLSWYELTIEPNTIFYKKPPTQPVEELTLRMEEAGRSLLAAHGFERYEISAYAQAGAQCQHNLNYWLFGDYFGIGAGAHGKLSLGSGRIERRVKWKMPQRYLSAQDSFVAKIDQIENQSDLYFEFFLNTARVMQEIPFTLFEHATGCSHTEILPTLEQLSVRGYLYLGENGWTLTKKGVQFSNEVVNNFLQ